MFRVLCFSTALLGATTAWADAPVMLLTFKPLAFDDTIRGAAPRELVRQSFILAAHELGWKTRDATLREYPAMREMDQLMKLDSFLEGDANQMTATLKRDDEVLWTKTYQLKRSRDYYQKLAKRLNADRQLIRAALQKLTPDWTPPEPPDIKIEKRIEPRLDMNLFTQMVHTRNLHRQLYVVKDVQSLAAISRSYAHASLLSAHHWFASSSVFLARSLLYADRAIEAANSDPDQLQSALLSRAYANAVMGRFGMALQDLGRVKIPVEDRPIWAQVIEPSSRFDMEALRALISQHEEIASVAAVIHFYLAVSQNGNITEASNLTAKNAPFAMGVYAELTKGRRPLDSSRWGARNAPMALRASVSRAFQDARGFNPRTKENVATIGEGEPEDVYHLPGTLSGHLVEALDLLDAESEVNWQNIGRLLQEEVFVGMVGFITDARNATKTDLSPYTESALSHLGLHPYREYIRAWGFDFETERDELKQSLASLTLIDPRPHMYQLQVSLWNMPTEKYDKFGQRAAQLAYPDNTEFSLSERSRHFREDPRFAANYARMFRFVSPHSPHLLRVSILATTDPSDEDLAEWEAKAGNDGEVWRLISQRLKDTSRVDDQLRVLKRHFEISPDAATVRELANHYLRHDKKDEFLTTLTEYLDDAPGSMANAGLANALAKRLMSLKRWKEAEPHVQRAIQTYSAWGLQTGSRYLEGIGELDASEHFIKELSTNYGGISRIHWYEWCRRLGRGELEAARELAATYFGQDFSTKNALAHEAKAVFHQLEGELQAAITALKRAHQLEPSYWNEMQIALLAHELGDAESRLWALAALKVRSQARPGDKVLAELVALAHLDQNTTPSLHSVDEYLVPDNWDVQCDVAYFAGECLRLLGDTERAEHYFEISLNSELELRAPTLAGFRISQLKDDR